MQTCELPPATEDLCCGGSGGTDDGAPEGGGCGSKVELDCSPACAEIFVPWAHECGIKASAGRALEPSKDRDKNLGALLSTCEDAQRVPVKPAGGGH